MILLCKTISLIDYLLKIAAWLFPSLATIISAIIIVYLGSWLIGKKLANIEELRILNRTKYQWKYDLLKSTTYFGLLYIESTVSFSKIKAEFKNNPEKNSLKDSLNLASQKWITNYREITLLAVQTKNIFDNQEIHAHLKNLLSLDYVKAIDKISIEIISNPQLDPIIALEPLTRKMHDILEKSINAISKEITDAFKTIEKRIKS